MYLSLALNLAGMPIDVISWKRAVTLWYLGKARVLSEYEGTLVRSQKVSIRIPAVIQCTDVSVISSHFTHILPFNRRNVYLRDNGQCVYCRKKIPFSGFTLDHVIPRCKGGETDWSNIVVSCPACNNKKGSKAAKKSGLNMKDKPEAPKLTKPAPKNLINKIWMQVPHKSWQDYIYWDLKEAKIH